MDVFCVVYEGGRYIVTDGVSKHALYSVNEELDLLEGTDGARIARMHANVATTKFEVVRPSGEAWGTLEFAWFSLKKGYGMRVGERAYRVEQRFDRQCADFTLVDEREGVALAMYDLGGRRALVLSRGIIPREFAIYGAVALIERRPLTGLGV